MIHKTISAKLFALVLLQLLSSQEGRVLPGSVAGEPWEGCENLHTVINLIGQRISPTPEEAFKAYQEYVDLYSIQSKLAVDYTDTSDSQAAGKAPTDSEARYMEISEILSSPELKFLVDMVFPKIIESEDSNGGKLELTPKLKATLAMVLPKLTG